MGIGGWGPSGTTSAEAPHLSDSLLHAPGSGVEGSLTLHGILSPPRQVHPSPLLPSPRAAPNLRAPGAAAAPALPFLAVPSAAGDASSPTSSPGGGGGASLLSRDVLEEHVAGLGSRLSARRMVSIAKSALQAMEPPPEEEEEDPLFSKATKDDLRRKLELIRGRVLEDAEKLYANSYA